MRWKKLVGLPTDFVKEAKHHMKRLLTVFGAVVLCSGMGCQNFGPRALQTTHPQYNLAISRSLDEQFLLNLVRLKYRDNPFFLEVSSVTTQQSIQQEVSTSAGFLPGRSTLSTVAGLTYKQTPTISYTPLRGDQFLKQILSPIPMEAVLILVQSGWSVERVMSICVERVNDLDNAGNASGPTPGREPRYKEFHEMVGILRELQLADAIELGAAPCLPDANGKPRPGRDLVLRIRPSPELAARIVRLKELLGVPGAGDLLRLTTDFLNRPENSLAVRTRSMMGILFYLSHNTRVPAADEQGGLVTVTQSADGGRFDWNLVTGNLLKVDSAAQRPPGAFIAVQHRGAWFYIRNNDLESKSTFMLLSQLFNLQAGQIKTVAPALTIGVGGG